LLLRPFTYVQTLAAELRTREEGQTMAEYAVVLAVITVAIILTLGVLSGAIQDAIQKVSDTLKSV
jgi:Flp pilus assembly pilin Flp